MSEETIPVRPYVHLLAGRDPAEVMRATPERLTAALTALTPEQIQQRPSPHKWSVRELLCHMTDCEIAWAWRLRQAYGAAKPTIQPFDQDPWARAYDGVLFTTDTARATWAALRSWNLALVETLSEADKQRPVLHPDIGELTLWTLVEIAAGHDLHHLAALEKLAGLG